MYCIIVEKSAWMLCCVVLKTFSGKPKQKVTPLLIYNWEALSKTFDAIWVWRFTL